jgi:hypothetical protein
MKKAPKKEIYYITTLHSKTKPGIVNHKKFFTIRVSFPLAPVIRTLFDG